MQVSSIMTADPICVGGDTSLDEAQRIMDDKRVRHLPVLDAGRLTGILSDRDLLEATGWLPARVHACRGGVALDRLPRSVREVMREPVHEVGPEASAAVASLRFLQKRIGCLPVLRRGTLVGIVTEMDVLELHAGTSVDCLPDGSSGPPVACFMSTNPVTVRWDASLGEAIDICRSERIRHLPVIGEHGQLGLVSDRDLRQARGSGHRLDARLEKVVTREVVRVRADLPLTQAAHIMAERRFSSLPVLEGGVLVGILTSTDVLEHFLELARSAEAEAD